MKMVNERHGWFCLICQQKSFTNHESKFLYLWLFTRTSTFWRTFVGFSEATVVGFTNSECRQMADTEELYHGSTSPNVGGRWRWTSGHDSDLKWIKQILLVYVSIHHNNFDWSQFPAKASTIAQYPTDSKHQWTGILTCRISENPQQKKTETSNKGGTQCQ